MVVGLCCFHSLFALSEWIKLDLSKNWRGEESCVELSRSPAETVFGLLPSAARTSELRDLCSARKYKLYREVNNDFRLNTIFTLHFHREAAVAE